MTTFVSRLCYRSTYYCMSITIVGLKTAHSDVVKKRVQDIFQIINFNKKRLA